jgi:asparagine synthase (glutamine-hydrolysing)
LESQTASEILLRAYLRWGKAMLDQIDGDFAIVVIDGRNGQVTAACDPMGMRSLFFRHVPGKGFWFATDQGALARLAGLDARLPESRLLESVIGIEELGYYRPVIAGVERLQAAEVLQVDSQRLRVNRYWSPYDHPPRLAEHDQDGWVEGLSWFLRDAVKKRIADGEAFGVMFSGGLDSSSVLALACEDATSGQVHAYSLVDRSNPDCRETHAINLMIAATGVKSVQIDLADAQAHQMALSAAAHAAQVVDGRAGFLLLLTQMAAAAGVRVMSNGLDSDALFSFHDWLKQLVVSGKKDAALGEARALDQMLGSGSWYERSVRRAGLVANLPKSWLAPIRAIRQLRNFNRVLDTFPLRRDAVHRLQLRDRLREHARAAIAIGVFDAELPPSSMGRLSVIESGWRVGMRSAQFGGSMRCPFFDRALIEFATWIPSHFRLHNGGHKWILRKAMESYLPPEVTWRCDKPHFSLQFDRLMLQPVLDQMIRAFRGSGPIVSAYVDRDLFLREAERWRQGDWGAVERLQMILLLENWLAVNADCVAFGH